MSAKPEENIFEAALRTSQKAALQMQHQMESLAGTTHYSEKVKFAGHLVHGQLISVHGKATDLVHYNEPLELLTKICEAHAYDFNAHMNFDELRNLDSQELRDKYDHTCALDHPPREPAEERTTHLSDHKDRAHARAASHKESVTLESRKACIDKLLAVDKKGVVETNFPKLLESCCGMAAATYNVRRVGDEGPNEEHVANEHTKMHLLSAFAYGFTKVNDTIQIKELKSEVGCGIFVYSPLRDSIYIAFRGTKEPIDLQTDLTSIPEAFHPQEPTDLDMQVHSGFAEVLKTLIPFIDAHLAECPESAKKRMIITGHSMGGALAMLAAAYYGHHKPILVTFGMPSIGNDDFKDHVEANVFPCGGIRVHNEGDAVPEVTKLVGFLHAGIPIQTHVKESAKTLYHKNCIGEIMPTFEGAAPHIIFTWGSLTYCLPGGIGAKEHHDFQIDLV